MHLCSLSGEKWFSRRRAAWRPTPIESTTRVYHSLGTFASTDRCGRAHPQALVRRVSMPTKWRILTGSEWRPATTDKGPSYERFNVA
jgi:hypothetical protein